MPGPFKGTIDLDIRTSTPDWDAFLDPKPPKGAPNVLVILYDDTGRAVYGTGACGSAGARLNTAMSETAGESMKAVWHATVLCSPPRSAWLTAARPESRLHFGTREEDGRRTPTGRNHHDTSDRNRA